MKRAIFTFFSALVVLFILVMPAFADGQYGGGSTTTTEQPKEEVTHSTVEADLGDNLFAIAAIFGGIAMISLFASKVTARVYLLDK
jgi:hypothetical protein